jgi:hypothetical protein
LKFELALKNIGGERGKKKDKGGMHSLFMSKHTLSNIFIHFPKRFSIS